MHTVWFGQCACRACITYKIPWVLLWLAFVTARLITNLIPSLPRRAQELRRPLTATLSYTYLLRRKTGTWHTTLMINSDLAHFIGLPLWALYRPPSETYNITLMLPQNSGTRTSLDKFCIQSFLTFHKAMNFYCHDARPDNIHICLYIYMPCMNALMKCQSSCSLT